VRPDVTGGPDERSATALRPPVRYHHDSTMDEPTDLIASMKLFAVAPDGTEQLFTVGVAVPQQQPTGEWACPTLWHDLDTPRPIFGDSSLQALCLGLSFIRLRLEDYLNKGGRLLHAIGREELSQADLAPIFGR
jgi:hypothetical protein